MSVKHPGLPIPDDWNGQDWCHYAICWPDSLLWRAILAGFIYTPSLGRTWDGATGSIIDTQVIGREIVDRNLDWRYAIVSSCDNGTILADAIMYLANKMASVGCCGSPGTPGGAGTGGAPSAPSGPVTAPVVNEPPTGFDTWDAFKVYQCDVLTWATDQFEADLNQLQVINFAGMSVTSLLAVIAAILLLPIAGSDLFVLAANLASGYDALGTLIDAYSGVKGDVLCALYSHLDPTEARNAALSIINTAIDSQSATNAQKVNAKTIASTMLTYDTINRAYVLDETRSYPTGDCAACSEDCTLDSPQIIIGEGDVPLGEILSDTTDGDTRTVEVGSTLYQSAYNAGLTSGVHSGCNWQITSFSQTINTTNNVNIDYYDSNGNRTTLAQPGNNVNAFIEGLGPVQYLDISYGFGTWSATFEFHMV